MEGTLGPGARVGAYEVIDRLGSGGMGEVYRARDLRLGRTVALKVLRAGAEPDLLRRLDREARSASALNHANIVHIYDVGEAPDHDGAHYVAMEHVEGETLRRRLAGGALPIAQVTGLGAQIAEGLAKAHQAGIIHRDIKPENLMITPEGVVKILDFGLVKLVAVPLADLEGKETLSRHSTQVGMLVGTLEYMSPEQASGRPLDHRSDQFALGLVLYEMATGRTPFRRDTPAQVLAALIERDPEPLRRLRPDAPAELEALVARCLAKDPAGRFERTADLAAQLSALTDSSRAFARAELVPPAAALPPLAASAASPLPVYSGRWVVQSDDRSRTYEEKELTKRIRSGKYTGLEMVRREEEDSWQPMFESRIYKREVPSTGDPRDFARRRALRAAGGHLSGFFTTGAIMYATQGHIPFWMGIWGAVMLPQLLRAAPAAWSLGRDALGRRPAPGLPAPPPPEAPRLLAIDARLAGSPIADEAARVRALLEQRGGSEAPRLLAEVDGILRLTAELAARQADLEEQTSERERAGLGAAEREARSKIERASLAQDRRLFERQLEVVQRRQETIDKALRVLTRLRVRRELAEHQLKQLRLDLSRGAASGLDVPELSSRLQFIRHEVDAIEDVEERGAD